MSIRAVKDKRPSRSVRVGGVGVGLCVLGLSCMLHLKDKGKGYGSN